MKVGHIDFADSRTGDAPQPGAGMRVPTTREVLEEMFQLLEDYAPAWYTEQLHDRAVAALTDQPV